MRFFNALAFAAIAFLLLSCAQRHSPQARTFETRGTVKEVRTNSIVVEHETIPGYMDAMTMPFNVKDAANLQGIRPGDRIRFQLLVTETESWIDHVIRVASAPAPENAKQNESPNPIEPDAAAQPSTNIHPLRAYKFTNELGQPVALTDFKGKALAITFIFTRCPVPDFCPRLSRNFQQAQAQLTSMPNAPTNWHLLSVTIDPDFDKPAVLRSYGDRYGYDPKHWSFLTGPKEKIAELAKLSDVTYEWQGGLLNHNFRTLIITPTGALQMQFPIGGDISGAVVQELLKAMAGSDGK